MRRLIYTTLFRSVLFRGATQLLTLMLPCRSNMHCDHGHHAGDFATQGVEKKHPAPGLWVNGVGCIALPLLAPQATQLKGVCEQAPFGRGERTLVDKTIRNALQLSPDQFQLKNTGRLGPFSGEML